MRHRVAFCRRSGERTRDNGTNPPARARPRARESRPPRLWKIIFLSVRPSVRPSGSSSSVSRNRV